MKYDFIKDGITQSLMANYMLCPQKYENSIQWKEAFQSNTIFGTFGHKMLEQIYLGKKAEIFNYQFPKEVKQEEQEYMRAVGEILIDEYLHYYGKEKIKPEILFDTNLEGFKLKGKIDGIKGNYLFETKFKTQIVEDKLQERLILDWQTNFYLVVYHCLTGKYLDGVIYNVIRYPKRSTKGNMKTFCDSLQTEIREKPEYFFYRYQTEFSKEHIEQFEIDLITKLARIKGQNIIKNQCACDLYGGCSFVKLCAKGDTDGLVKRKVMFEELTN